MTRYGRTKNIFLKQWYLIRDPKDSKRLLIIPGKGNREHKEIEAAGSRTHSRKRK